MKPIPFHQKLGFSSFTAGIAWLLYAYFFVIAQDPLMSGLFLTIAGLMSLEALVGLYTKLKDEDHGWSLIALILGAAGTLGTAIHGAYDLANAINPPVSLNMDIPSEIDPRGFLAFGVTGFAILKFAYLMWTSRKFSQNFALLGLVSGILLIIIYLGRLIVLSPAQPILKYPILLEGFIINPLWYLWLGYMAWNRKEGMK